MLTFPRTILVGISLAAVAVASADTLSEFKTFYKAFIPKQKQAYANKDYKFFDSVIAPNYTYSALGTAKSTRADSMKGMRALFAQATSINSTVKTGEVKASGNSATIVVWNDITIGMTDPSKKPHKMNVKTHYLETWQKKGSKWQMTAMKDLSKMEMSMDGKKVNVPTNNAPKKPVKAGTKGH